MIIKLYRDAQVDARGLMDLITAVAYHFCPSLPAAFKEPGASTLADLCMYLPGQLLVLHEDDSDKEPEQSILP